MAADCISENQQYEEINKKYFSNMLSFWAFFFLCVTVHAGSHGTKTFFPTETHWRVYEAQISNQHGHCLNKVHSQVATTDELTTSVCSKKGLTLKMSAWLALYSGNLTLISLSDTKF